MCLILFNWPRYPRFIVYSLHLNRTSEKKLALWLANDERVFVQVSLVCFQQLLKTQEMLILYFTRLHCDFLWITEGKITKFLIAWNYDSIWWRAFLSYSPKFISGFEFGISRPDHSATLPTVQTGMWHLGFIGLTKYSSDVFLSHIFTVVILNFDLVMTWSEVETSPKRILSFRVRRFFILYLTHYSRCDWSILRAVFYCTARYGALNLKSQLASIPAFLC